MITLSAQIRAALAAEDIVTNVAIDLLWPAAAGGPQYFTDSPFPFVFNSNNYSPILGGLLQISTPQSRSLIERDEFNIVLSNNDNFYNNRIAAAPSGVEMILRVLFRNPSTNALLTGNLPVFRGFSSGASFSSDGTQRQVTIEFTSPLTKLTQVRERVTSDPVQRGFSATDSSLIHVHDSTNEATLKWGRE